MTTRSSIWSPFDGACAPIEGRSESAAQLLARQQAAIAAFPAQLAAAETAGDYLVWNATLDDRTTELCLQRNGFKWGDGWMLPPPAHFDCRSVLKRVPKPLYTPPE